MFNWAILRKQLTENPITFAMPKKNADKPVERIQWSPSQIREIFSSPMFTGTASLQGYREKSGTKVEHDEKFWIPLIAVWSGMRLDEIGTLSTDEIKCEDGIHIFDLRRRPTEGYRRLKNKTSARPIPIHPVLIELGFLKYVEQQEEWVFPNLPHRPNSDTSTTAQFSKWFGLWRDRNCFGIDDKKQDFHAFRHSFKDACRRHNASDKLNDELTGHSGSSDVRVSRGYAARTSLEALDKIMSQVSYDDFPIDRIKKFGG
jgi:integrase